MPFKSRIQESINKLKHTANTAVGELQESAEKLYDLKNKSYNVEVTVDKDGVKHEVTTVRPTQHTIKWKAKGH